MPQIANERLVVEASEDGGRIVLRDVVHRTEWRLDSPLVAGGEVPTEGPKATGAGRARREGEAVVVRFGLEEGGARGDVVYRWTLGAEYVQVTVETDLQVSKPLPLPGAFLPASGRREVAVPIYQGLLVRASGKEWKRNVLHGGHNAMAMCMAVVFGESSGLLLAHESAVNWTGYLGETVGGAGGGGPFFYFQQSRCPVEAWRDATVRIYPVERSLTAACRAYRRVMQARGWFASWDQKIAEKPIVKELFGSLMAFVGYNKAPDIDYADGARRLREYGFESVLYYPLRMSAYSLDFKMGGDDPIWLSDAQLAAVQAVPGAHMSPWAWTFEGIDDGSAAMRGMFRHNQKGPIAGWKIDQTQWYQICTPYQTEHIKKRLSSDMKMMDWLHYDVTANIPASCCHAPHALHGGRPMSAREDVEAVRKLMGAATVGNRMVSSEGFTDHNTPWYDIGSTKMMPPLNESPSFVPVPMTMLVYHDSCAHSWWEVHNYNATPPVAGVGGPEVNDFNINDLPLGLGSAGAGSPKLKAAIDALYGSAPHVFPFGRQYAWSNFRTKETYSYTIRLDDAATQEALAAALPVARLHKKVGRCDLIEHEMLSDDGYVQGTVFSDGTRIIANLSRKAREAGRHGQLAGHSWREVSR